MWRKPNLDSFINQILPLLTIGHMTNNSKHINSFSPKFFSCHINIFLHQFKQIIQKKTVSINNQLIINLLSPFLTWVKYESNLNSHNQIQKKEDEIEKERMYLSARRDNNRSTFQTKSLGYAETNSLCWSSHDRNFSFESLWNFHFYFESHTRARVSVVSETEERRMKEEDSTVLYMIT